MKEIKFRGKRVDNGEWVYGSFSKYKVVFPNGSTCWQIEVVDVDGHRYPVIPETVGQYTGLKSFWEADIVSWKGKPYGIIEWSDSQLGWVLVNLAGEYLTGFSKRLVTEFGLEVIGSKWENKELLK